MNVLRAAIFVGVLLQGCRTEAPTGQLMLVLDGTVAVPDDIDWIHVDIRTGDKLVHTGDYALGPDHYALPSTLGIVPGPSGARAVRVRVVGRSGGVGGRIRVLREARTQIPVDRVAALPVLLSISCLDFVRDATSADTESSCGEDRTCVAGACGPIDIKAEDLPEYSEGAPYEDADAVVEISPRAGLVTTEAGGKTSFSVRLGTAPRADVRIPLASSRPEEGVVSATEVLFTPGNWDKEQVIEVTGVDDAAVDGDAAYRILVGAAGSADPRFDALDPPDVDVVNRDDDLVKNDTCGNAVPVRDDFERSPLDGTKWKTVTVFPKGSGSVTQANGYVELADRGYLSSARQFNPSVGVVRVTGTWTFVEIGNGDLLQILTRSDGIPSGQYGETQTGLECRLFASKSGASATASVGSRGAGAVSSTDAGSIVINQGETYGFEVVDDGSTFTCTIRRADGAATSTTATSAYRSTTNYVVFHNREKATTPHIARVDNVQIEQGAPRPTHQWTFDEPSGATAGDVVGSATGSLGASTTRSTGIVGGAVSLPGNEGGYVDLGAAVAPFGTADFSVSFWFNAPPSSNLQDLFGNRDAGNAGNYLSVRLRATGELSAELCEDAAHTNYVWTSWGSGLGDRAWHHAVVTRERASLTIFVDGVQVDTASSGNPTNLASSVPMQLGRTPISEAFNLHYTGAFDDLRLFDRALTPCEVSVLAARP